MSLAVWCYLLGGVALLMGGAGVLQTATCAGWLHSLPRNRIAAYILSAIAWVWAGYAIISMGLDFMRAYQKFIPVAVLVFIPLTWAWMPNLLACRALGGLGLLFPYELLHVARVHASPWRLALVTFAYLCIVAGMFTVLYPWRLRQVLHWLAARPRALRFVSGATILWGILLLFLGAQVLR